MKFYLTFKNHDVFSQVSPEEREWFLRNMVASSTTNEQAWLTMQREIATIMKGIIHELAFGTHHYDLHTGELLLEPKQIFKAMLRETLVFEPVPEREHIFIDSWKKMEASVLMEEINQGQGMKT